MKSFKSYIEEEKKYSMQQAIDHFAGDPKDVAWTMSSRKKGEPLFGHWLDMSSGEVVVAKEKTPPKGVKVYKEEANIEEEKSKNSDWYRDQADTRAPKKKKRKPIDSDWYRDQADTRKSKKTKNEEANPTSTADVVGTGDDVADWKDPKKKKRRPLTRHFIEVGGKRRKLTK